MNKALRSQKGFTLIELIMVIVILAFLSVVAVPIYVDLRTQAKEANENAVVAGVRAGVLTQYVKTIRDGGTGAYPTDLDDVADATACTEAAACFTKIMGASGVTSQWSKVSETANTDATYTSPTTSTWVYTVTDGTFLKQ